MKNSTNMNHSLSTVYVSEDVDSSNVLEEQVSSHFISDEPSSCLFDILSSNQDGHSSLLGDIDPDLQWDNSSYVDCTTNAEEMTGRTVYNVSGTVYSTSLTTTDGHKIKCIPPLYVIDGQSLGSRSDAADSSSRQLTFSFPISHLKANKLFKTESVSEEKFATCQHCSIQFSSKEALLAHNKDQHVKKEILLHECSYCHINFKSKKSLAKHFNMHKDKQEKKYDTCRESRENCMFLCESCPFVGKTSTRLNDHIKAKHSLERNVYSCERCGFSCLQEQTLTLHLQRHEDDPKFACDQCGKLFFTMSILKRHAHTHNKTRPFLCHFQHCGKSFNIKSRLTDHIRTVHKNKRLNFDVINSTLDGCNVTPSSDKHFSHSRQTDSSSSYSCKQNSSSELPELDTDVSTDTPATNSADIFIYDIVLPEDKIDNFNSAVDEDNNLKTSSTYSKALVNKNKIGRKNQTSFSSDSNIGIGQRLDNVKGRKFACTWDDCDKTFRDNYNLYVHMCTHTGEMQRACSFCRYRCVQKSAMDAHMKTHKNVLLKDV